MNPLKVTHPSVTQKGLLRKAESIPGAWNGIRIAALLLLLKGWNSTAISRLFGISRQAVVGWIGKANKRGLDSVIDERRPGRPARMSISAQQKLADALTKSPEEFGLRRTRWDGVVVVEFLKKVCNVELKPRQARNWLKRLGFVLKQPVYRHVQATGQGVAKFRRGLKKTPPNLEPRRTCVAGFLGRKRILAASQARSCLGSAKDAGGHSHHQSAL